MQSLDLEVLNHALGWKREGRQVWLITVTQTFGASPRPPGSLVAIRDDGILVGSVSGGCIEDDLMDVEAAPGDVLCRARVWIPLERTLFLCWKPFLVFGHVSSDLEPLSLHPLPLVHG